MGRNASLAIEVVAGLPDRQRLIELQVPPGSTIADAVRLSKVLRYFPEFDPGDLQYGIWGRIAAADRKLKTGDRVELYRPLKIEPREARRQLAALGKTMREGFEH